MKSTSLYSWLAELGEIEARGHILTDARELQSCADDDLVKVCEQTENCRRSTLLRSLGSNEIVDASSGTPCCDVCSAIMYQV